MENSKARNKIPPADGATFEEYMRMLKAFEVNLKQLKEMTAKYPIFIVIAATHYRFDSPEEVDEFLESLRAEVRTYESQHAAVG
jgi:5'(3')-deoxyribonucleotidase